MFFKVSIDSSENLPFKSLLFYEKILYNDFKQIVMG